MYFIRWLDIALIFTLYRKSSLLIDALYHITLVIDGNKIKKSL